MRSVSVCPQVCLCVCGGVGSKYGSVEIIWEGVQPLSPLLALVTAKPSKLYLFLPLPRPCPLEAPNAEPGKGRGRGLSALLLLGLMQASVWGYSCCQLG